MMRLRSATSMLARVRAVLALLPLYSLCALCLQASGCASDGLDIRYAPGPEASASVWKIDVIDAREFTTASDPAPVPSTERTPIEAAWTRRVFGRQLVGTGSLGADVFTAAGQSVPELVRLAVIAGLDKGGSKPPPPAAAGFEATIEAFWIWREPISATPRLQYVAHVRLRGPAPGFEHGLYLETRGSTGGGAPGGMLWETAIMRVLEKLEQEAAQAVRRANPVP